MNCVKTSSSEEFLKSLLLENDLQGDLDDLDIDMDYRFSTLVDTDKKNGDFAMEDPFAKKPVGQLGTYFRVILISVLLLFILFLISVLISYLFSSSKGGATGVSAPASTSIGKGR